MQVTQLDAGMGSVIVVVLLMLGVFTGLTTVLFGFGGGFVTVPVILWADATAGGVAGTVAVATSAIVMVVNASIATAATPRSTLTRLRGRAPLLALLAAGGLIGAVITLLTPSRIGSWGFVIYVAITIFDVLARPGFLRPAQVSTQGSSQVTMPTVIGAPIGAIASFLGVGGSVMTVPLLRRSGLVMREATALANPLTLAISVPAGAVFLLAHRTGHIHGAVLAIGNVDLGAATLLLLGAIPVIVLLRRHPPRIPDRAYAVSYIGLLLLTLAAMTAPLV